MAVDEDEFVDVSRGCPKPQIL